MWRILYRHHNSTAFSRWHAAEDGIISIDYVRDMWGTYYNSDKHWRLRQTYVEI